MARKKNGKKCWYCGKKITPKNYSLDHKIPRVKGGNDSKYNKVVACIPCNQDKSNMTVGEYRAVIAYRNGLVKKLERVVQFYGEKK